MLNRHDVLATHDALARQPVPSILRCRFPSCTAGICFLFVFFGLPVMRSEVWRWRYRVVSYGKTIRHKLDHNMYLEYALRG